MRPKKITPDEETIALGKWGETYWLEKKFWDWYKKRHPNQEESAQTISTAVCEPPLSKGW